MMGDADRWDDYPGFAWERDSLAVVASDGNGTGCVLYTVGPFLRMEIEEYGLHALEELGLDDAPAGISIWVGRYAYFTSRTAEGIDEGAESEPRGSFRSPTDSEWTAIREGRCPWDDAEWRREGET